MMASEKRCLYEVLGLTTDAAADEIRSAYKKLALQLHPDKLVRSGLSKADATAQFQELVNAYEVLSNPKERAWYDSHRSQILFSDPTSTSSFVPNLFSFFSNSVFSGYGDTGKGFYKVYSDVFDKIYACEVNFAKKLGLGSVKEAPVMGNLRSPYTQVTAFYGYWLGFCTMMDFGWVDEFDAMAGPNRKSRRLMEEENRKLRKKAKREYNETVRGLAEFVKRRDKRVIDMQMKKNLEVEKRKEEERRRKKELEREKLERARAYEEPEWAKVVEDDGNDDDWEFEDAGGKKEEEFYCVLCGKKFKSEKQWKNHEQSRKHKERVAEFRDSVEDEEEEGRDEEDAEERVHSARDESQVDELQEQFEDGLELGEEGIEDGIQIQSSEEEEFVVPDISHSVDNKNGEMLDSDDETALLEAMVSGHRNRKVKKNRKNAATAEPESSATETPIESNSDEMDFMEYDNRRSSRRRRAGKKDRGKKSDGVAMRPDISLGDNGATETTSQDDENNAGLEDSSIHRFAETDTNGKEDDHSKTNKISKQPHDRKANTKEETKTKPKESNKIRKAKAAQRKAMGNTCETCGENFDTRNKLHKHLGDTGHATLRAR